MDSVQTADELKDAIQALKDAIDGLVENKRVVSATTILALVQDFEQENAFRDAQTARSLKVHLNAVAQFEKKEAADKVVKHMNSFKALLDYQKNEQLISHDAYKALTASSDALIKKWE